MKFRKPVSLLLCAAFTCSVGMSANADDSLPPCSQAVEDACEMAGNAAVLAAWYMPWAWSEIRAETEKECKLKAGCSGLGSTTQSYGGGS